MKIWSSISNWDLVLPPSRPNEYQLGIVQKVIFERSVSNLKIAVLGSTPEFRDLICELGIETPYVFDKSVDFYQKMSNYRVYNNTEFFVHGDWFDTLPRFKSFFDIILSDLTAGNIIYDNRKKFYELIGNALIPHGVFVDKHLTNENGLITISNIANKYEKLPLNLNTINDFSCEAIFCSEFQAKFEIIDTTKIYEMLKIEFAKMPKLLRFVEMAHFITPEECVWYYGKPDIDYIKNLCLNDKYPMSNTVYDNHAWVFVWGKN